MATYNGHNEDSSGNILLSIGNGMTATVETGTTASQAYTKGSYLFFNNRLCKATSAISRGASLAIGTNLSQTSIGQEITSHLRASNGDEFYFDYKDSKPGYYPSASKVASQFVPFGGTWSAFSPVGRTATVLGTNFTVGKYYVFRLFGSYVFDGTFVGANVISSSGNIGSLGQGYTRSYILQATSTTITSSVSFNNNPDGALSLGTF